MLYNILFWLVIYSIVHNLKSSIYHKYYLQIEQTPLATIMFLYYKEFIHLFYKNKHTCYCTDQRSSYNLK